MNSRIVSLVAVAGLLVYVLQAPRDPIGPPPGFEIPDYEKNPPPKGPGAGDPMKMGSVDVKPKDGDAKKKADPADKP